MSYNSAKPLGFRVTCYTAIITDTAVIAVTGWFLPCTSQVEKSYPLISFLSPKKAQNPPPPHYLSQLDLGSKAARQHVRTQAPPKPNPSLTWLPSSTTHERLEEGNQEGTLSGTQRLFVNTCGQRPLQKSGPGTKAETDRIVYVI